MISSSSGLNELYSVSQENLADWLDRIQSSAKLIAHQEVGGILLYQPVSDSRQIAWTEARPTLSSKDAFFPPTEQLFTIQREGNNLTIVESEPVGKQVLFGIRPCDAQGIKALDALYLETDPADNYYQRRREATTIIGMACREMAPSCFCTSVGGAPDDSRFMDLMLYRGDDHYFLAVITDKGASLLSSFPLKSDLLEAESAAEQIKSYIPSRLPIEIPNQEDWPASFASPYWDEMSERCISCRICAYVCPTCRCFDVRDQLYPSENGTQVFERIRCWDSCTGTAYRRIAGGHNPRPEKGQRLRNRFFCKYYYYPAQYGPVACTGCGRCIDACPVGVDITEALSYVAQRGSLSDLDRSGA